MDTISTSKNSKVRYKDYGILILRLGVGIILLAKFGYIFFGKIPFLNFQFEGFEWFRVGLILVIILANFAFIIGYYTRFVSTFLALTFLISFGYYLLHRSTFAEFSNDLMMSVVFFACIYLGGGKLSVDYKNNHYKVHIEGTGAL